jgi:hypothetical protein
VPSSAAQELAAGLSLHVVRFVQGGSEPPRSPLRWLLMPDTRPLPYRDACARLAATPKPVVLAPLQEFGWLGIWRYESLEVEEQRRLEIHLRRQRDFLEEAIAQLEARPDDRVVFATAGEVLELSVMELRLWAAQYAMGCGWTLAPGSGADERFHLQVLRPDGIWSEETFLIPAP